MNNSGSADFSDKLARIISVIFHPLLMPVYGLGIVFWAPTLYNYLPFDVKKLVILIVLVNNVLLPLSLIPFFVHNKVISSWFLNERQDRSIPLIIATILYGVTTYIIIRFPVPFFLKTFFLASGLLSLIATLINIRWKISLHSIGAGLLPALVLILSFKMYTPLLWYIIPSFLAAGLILSSRLQLKLHSPAQVWSGFITGFVGFSLFVLLLQHLS
ncbi:MAG: hypothetical protein IPN67_02245 [Bacteroidales bacterium]|nr:hypothetical protein [Bacteroidales bacterium]